MARMLAFNLLFLLCVGYALARGRAPERIVALIFCAARMASDLAMSGGAYRQPEIGVLAVDGLTFAGLTAVALTADRFWPILVSAMQGVSLFAHFGRLVAQDILPQTYLNAVQLWAYPQLLLLLAGALRVDLRSRDRALGWWPFPRNDLL
jgi:hypothetical protein